MSLNWAEGERMSHVLLWVSCLSAGLGFLPHFVFTWSSSLQEMACDNQVMHANNMIPVHYLFRDEKILEWTGLCGIRSLVRAAEWRHLYTGTRENQQALRCGNITQKGSTADYGIMRVTANHHCHCYHCLVSLLLPSDKQMTHIPRPHTGSESLLQLHISHDFLIISEGIGKQLHLQEKVVVVVFRMTEFCKEIITWKRAHRNKQTFLWIPRRSFPARFHQ